LLSPSFLFFGCNGAPKKVMATTLPLPSFIFFAARQQRRQQQLPSLSFLFFGYNGASKKAMATTLPSPFFFWLQRTKEGDGNCRHLLVFFWLLHTKEGDYCRLFFLVVCFCGSILAKKKKMTASITFFNGFAAQNGDTGLVFLVLL
jgi:hypothetical protein